LASIGTIVYGFAKGNHSLTGGVIGGLAVGGVTTITILIIVLIIVAILLPMLFLATCGTIPSG